MGLNVKDLIEGRVYYFDWISDTQTVNYISRYSTSKKVLLNISSRNFNNISYNFWEDKPINNIREATQDEIDWLEACEKEGKFVDKPIGKKEFIVDKWYKSGSENYIKFKEITRSTTDTYNKVFGETISYKRYNSFDYWASTELEKRALNNGPLEDLSEIQQYLPENHIDKIKSEYLKPEELIEGCWYIVKTGTPFEALFKFKKIKSDAILYDGDYYDYGSDLKLGNNTNGLCDVNSIKELKPASNEEVLKYFPDEKFSDESLKVGDWAIGLSYAHLGSICYNNGVKAFKILFIDYNNNRFTYQHIDNQGKSWESSDYNFNLIRKATNSEIPKMRFEEALIECKKRYPIGTKFHPLSRKYPNGDIYQTFTIEGNMFLEFKNSVYKSKEAIIENETSGILWYNGVFAEIVEEGNNLSTIKVEAKTVSSELISVVDQLKDYTKEFNWEEIEIEVTLKAKEVSKPKKTRLQIFEEVIPIKVEEVVKLTVKSKINKNK